MARARATPRAKVGYPRASRHGGGAGYAHRSERHRPGPAQAAGTRDSQSRGRCRELRAFFADLLGKATAFVLIAERSGDAVGWLSFDVQERPSTPFTRARRRPYVQHGRFATPRAALRGDGADRGGRGRNPRPGHHAPRARCLDPAHAGADVRSRPRLPAVQPGARAQPGFGAPRRQAARTRINAPCSPSAPHRPARWRAPDRGRGRRCPNRSWPPARGP
jgi:hypothetical protein